MIYLHVRREEVGDSRIEVGVYIQSGRSMDTDVEKVVTPVAKKQDVNICGYAPLAAYQYEPNRACDAF